MMLGVVTVNKKEVKRLTSLFSGQDRLLSDLDHFQQDRLRPVVTKVSDQLPSLAGMEINNRLNHYVALHNYAVIRQEKAHMKKM